ncbi:hypothetical protein ACFOY2_48980 [Nonomuraea purpurea]|uniref:Uncharacterized protein n=1 Tax=Nonomuraea purpurea TaxID=1849276 RepID=A0ABV8GSM5_9ACTN
MGRLLPVVVTITSAARTACSACRATEIDNDGWAALSAVRRVCAACSRRAATAAGSYPDD